ncbi:hypothetical protein JL101_035540 (plasmid) [Skermanella rosea]|uniref:hypothetical protein n=1 Tax=Skermanella rosea TaxID=1817965 RepID=UPI00193181B7|nr:hypothetical protein [Skermanella rosea]UEM08113.1 hypothetical protein JL101_035540 [Skermanella rosea]
MQHGWKHDTLLKDLEAHLLVGGTRLVWTDMQLGPAGSPRPDVYTVPPSFRNFHPLAYEVKISVADYRRDVTAGKWQSYLRYASGVIFAVPKGLIGKADLPPGCGLIVRGEEGWATVKAPTLRSVENLPMDAWIKLLIDGIQRQRTAPVAERPSDAWSIHQRLRKAVGEDVAALVADRFRARVRFKEATNKLEQAATEAVRARERLLKEAREGAERDARLLDESRAELARALGLAPDAAAWAISNACREAARRLAGDCEVERLQACFHEIRRTLERADNPLPAIAREPATLPGQ